MRVLLDTHAFLWFLTDHDRLDRHAHSLITAPARQVLLSVGSLWEMVVKLSIGKLQLAQPFEELIPAQMRQEHIDILPIEISHFAELRRLPYSSPGPL